MTEGAGLETLMGRRFHTSVRVHNLFIPANQLNRRLHRFAQNLVLLTDCKDFPFQLIGTSAGLHYRRKRFLVCTDHQIRQIDAVENVGIILPEHHQYTSSSGSTFFSSSTLRRESDAEDLRVFDFTEPASTRAFLSRRFFDLGINELLQRGDDVLGYIAFGCPFADQNYNIADENHLGMAIRAITCEPENQPSDLALGLCRALSPMAFDPNGLSGGPVFAVVSAGGELTVKFAGIINRAGSGLIYFIKATEVQKLLDLFVDWDH